MSHPWSEEDAGSVRAIALILERADKAHTHLSKYALLVQALERLTALVGNLLVRGMK